MTPFTVRLDAARESGTDALIALAVAQVRELADLVKSNQPTAKWRYFVEELNEMDRLLSDPVNKDGTSIADMDVLAEYVATEAEQVLTELDELLSALCVVLSIAKRPGVSRSERQQVERWKARQAIAAQGRAYDKAQRSKARGDQP